MPFLLIRYQAGSYNGGEVSALASLALERFSVGDEILHAHTAQVLIGLNEMKHRPRTGMSWEPCAVGV